MDDPSSSSAGDWVNLASSGVSVGANRITVRGNQLRNVRFGISVSGANARVQHNVIDGFSADGLRGLGDGGLFEYNTIKNAYVGSPTDSNHDDGFQSWFVGPGGVGTGEVRDVVLRGNVFINNEKPNHSLHATLQGIGCFDGFFVNWVVENNVVITDHWHGISFYGMRDSRIVDNTVIDIDDVSPGPPWIRVTDHKDGPRARTWSSATTSPPASLSRASTSSTTTTSSSATLRASLFANAPYDLRLLETAAAVDAGSSDLAPALDADRVPRPQGPEVDIGACEWLGPMIFGDGFEGGHTGAWSTAP